MKRRSPDDASQLALDFYTPVVVVPQGDGSCLVKPGKPLQRLTPAQFGKAVGLDRNTVYDYLNTEFIPERFVQYSGTRRIFILSEAVEFYLAVSKAKRGLGIGFPRSPDFRRDQMT